MSDTPDAALEELELTRAALLAGGAITGGTRSRSRLSFLSQLGYAGATLTLALIACVFAFPVGLAAAASWWLLLAGWSVIG